MTERQQSHAPHTARPTTKASVFNWRKAWAGVRARKGAWAVLLVLAVQTLLASPDLTPAYAEINAFDEAKYIESGRLLLEGELRELTWGPLVALAYAPFHLVFGNLPDWFVIGRGAG